MKRYSLEDLRSCTAAVLTPVQVADVLGCDPHWIRVAARDNPELLQFPVQRVGSRTKIPRIPFLRFMGVLPDEEVS